MSCRKRNSRNGFTDVESAWKHLTEVSNQLCLSKRLTPGQFNRLTKVTRGQTQSEQPNRIAKKDAARKEKLFFDKIYKLDYSFFVLCAVALTQYKIDSTKQVILNNLVNMVERSCNEMTVVYRSVQSTVTDLERAARTLDGWVFYGHADREGVRKVFGDAMVDRIETAEMNENWRAVTSQFPTWPKEDLSVPCPITLNIREGSAKEVAMELFRVEVVWMVDRFHVIHENGTLSIIHDSVYQLVGPLDEDIGAVFPSNVHAAITACPIRVKELAEGKRRTTCVSMNFLKGKGTVKLEMGLNLCSLIPPLQTRYHLVASF
ncbi:hypothetical protein GQ44DRAFT_728166 [Phaeosphaeriaceae sp. PMI808]|nr:hypothetical protein GQ44DRAFT_728166 [Phaeosphaeriaceae sp. PMI808]